MLCHLSTSPDPEASHLPHRCLSTLIQGLPPQGHPRCSSGLMLGPCFRSCPSAPLLEQYWPRHKSGAVSPLHRPGAYPEFLPLPAGLQLWAPRLPQGPHRPAQRILNSSSPQARHILPLVTVHAASHLLPCFSRHLTISPEAGALVSMLTAMSPGSGPV